MGESLGHLGQVSRQYQETADAYENILLAAARAEAAHKAARAKRILSALATEDRVSHAKAETIAEADDEVAQLYHQRLTTQAIADAHRQKLTQLREQVANGRTYVASEREVDKIHADGRTP